MIIDKSYFTGKLNIPNLEQDNTANPDLITNNSIIDRLIEEYELKYLSDVFGIINAKTILQESQVETPAAKYVKLLDGDGDKWLGLRYEINGVKYSQIANFVYCLYLYENENRLTNFGVTSDQAEKSKVVSSWHKYNYAWREMIIFRQPQWLNRDYYDLHHDPYAYKNKDFKTLFEYIRDSEDWSDDFFMAYDNTNALGI